jgi:shikimate kinase
MVVFEDSDKMSIVKFKNIFLIGPMGAGKSTIGRALAKELKLDFYDSDEEIEIRAGADIAWIYDVEGEEGYRRREQKVIDELTLKTNIVLATGGGAIMTSQNRNSLAARGTPRPHSFLPELALDQGGYSQAEQGRVVHLSRA